MRVPILTYFKRTLLWLRQIFAILLPATPRRAATDARDAPAPVWKSIPQDPRQPRHANMGRHQACKPQYWSFAAAQIYYYYSGN